MQKLLITMLAAVLLNPTTIKAQSSCDEIVTTCDRLVGAQSELIEKLHEKNEELLIEEQRLAEKIDSQSRELNAMKDARLQNFLLYFGLGFITATALGR